MGQWLRDHRLLPDIIFCSTAKRAHKTAQKVIDSSGYSGPLELESSLYAARPEEYLAVLAGAADAHRRAMVVGHNPGLEELLEQLTGVYEPLPTAALAQVDLPLESWRDLDEPVRATLVGVWRPRELDV